jgi:magnesium transporter
MISKCIDYYPEQFQNLEITDIQNFLMHHRPSWSKVRWINIIGTNEQKIVEGFAEKYQLHPLAIEDVVQGTHRPKIEDYPGSEESPGRLFIVANLVEQYNNLLKVRQISIFLGRSTVLTFQSSNIDIFSSIYHRIETRGSRIRNNDASFLCYSLLDNIVDDYFPLLESYSEQLEKVEDELMDRPNQITLQKVHQLKRELLFIRRAIWPMRELIAQLQRDTHECLSETTLTYFRDVHDHCIQIIDLVETYHDMSTTLTETYMSVVSNRMNEVMKVLTVISTIFIPLTFLAGIYGMNMPIPENNWPLTYPIFWIICIIIALVMLYWFRRRNWI